MSRLFLTSGQITVHSLYNTPRADLITLFTPNWQKNTKCTGKFVLEFSSVLHLKGDVDRTVKQPVPKQDGSPKGFKLFGFFTYWLCKTCGWKSYSLL